LSSSSGILIVQHEHRRLMEKSFRVLHILKFYLVFSLRQFYSRNFHTKTF